MSREAELRAIASECNHFTPAYHESLRQISEVTGENAEPSCDECAHFDGGDCRIYQGEHQG
ncbi:MAG: hypothetical protein M1598_06755 [Actinobacteria bacterium]|nr:hypothetical protein [Actinomycetota bacterium]